MDDPQNSNRSAETLTGAPPSPQEVKVRTMQSDLASMAQNGGGLPQYENVKIAHTAGTSRGAGAIPGSLNSDLVSLIVAIVAVIVLLIAGYFGYVAVKEHDAEQVSGATGAVTQ